MAAFVRCTSSKCKFAVRLENAAEHGIVIAERIESKGYGIYARTEKVKRIVSRNICPSCSSYNSMTVERIHGVVTDHVCDARCTSARGKVCECSCGGANHGMSL